MDFVLIGAAIAAGGILSGAGVASASGAHKAKVRRFLNRPLAIDSVMQKNAERMGIDGAAVVGVSTFDVLYNTMKIDGHVLSGIDRLHHAREFGSLGDLMSYLKEDIIKYGPGGEVLRSIVHKYKGYTGEEQVFEKLAGDGHEISVPESGTQPGYDVLVDGKPYNVKVTDSPRYIQEHLDSHPDIDVITNREMAAAFGDDPRVLIDDNLSVQDAFHLTNDTLEAVGDMGGVLDQVPYLALAINAVKQGRRLYKGEVDWKTAGEHMAVDTAATGIGGLMGGKAGLALGLALAPVTGGASVVVVPAAALLGSLAGVFTSKLGGNWIKARHLRAAESRLDVAASLLAETFLRLKADVRSRVSAYFDTRITEARSGSAGAGTGMRKRLFPTVEKVFYEMAEEEFCREKKADLDSLSALEREVSALPSKAAGLILVQKDPAIFMGVDPLPSLHADAVELVKDVAEEKRKLG